MARAMWSGSISFGLVNVPVKLYSAVQPKDVSFSLLRKSDGSHIQYKKVSAADGKEVSNAEIIKGYELSPDKYVTLTEEELESLEPEKSHSIAIQKFVDAKELECLYFDRTYYLGPDKKSERAYALLTEAMKESNKAAVARIVLHNKEHVVVLRPRKNAISLFTLYYADEIVDADTIDNLPQKKDMPTKSEMTVAQQLIDSISGPFDLGEYHNQRREQIHELAQRKAAGKKVVTAPAAGKAAPNVLDLMGALKASVAASKKTGAKEPVKAPKKRKTA